MRLQLHSVLKRHGISYAQLSLESGFSKTAIGRLVSQGEYPKRQPSDAVRQRIDTVLENLEVPVMARVNAFETEAERAEPQRVTAAQQGCDDQSQVSSQPTDQQENNDMLLRKTSLSPDAKKSFGLFRDPFIDDVKAPEDVFATPDIRYVREALWQTARHGGFVAVVGESGSGKSTLRRDLVDRIVRDDANCVIIEPYVLGLEDNDQKGKTLKASAIADAIIATVAPQETIKRTQDAKYRQLHRVLRDSRRSGMSHVLVIEEAHGLSLPTLKHLKRFWELEDGFQKLLGIVLIGQPELRLKLSERNPEVREVVQRCELVELMPLDAHLEGYLDHKLTRVGCGIGKVIDDSGIAAIRDKLSFSRNGRPGAQISLLYPLAVANLLTASMNLAADLGAGVVTGDIVKEA